MALLLRPPLRPMLARVFEHGDLFAPALSLEQTLPTAAQGAP